MTKADDKRALVLAKALAGHTLCRPPRGSLPVKSEFANTEKLWRLGADGFWREDNKQPGLAFVGELDGNVIVWSSACKCPYLDGCPAGAGSEFALQKLDLPAVGFDRRRPIASVARKTKRK